MMIRSPFMRLCLLVAWIAAAPSFPSRSAEPVGGGLLYNGIRLPKEWPPRSIVAQSLDPIDVPYVKHGLHWNRRSSTRFRDRTACWMDPAIMPDSWAVFPDYEGKDPKALWKMFLRGPEFSGHGDLPK